ncbi:hypothetical protein VCRLGP107_110019 [Vibrio crassostreae]|nr:hypothetical protein VCRLGP107_110019 [Vibrio crassostreae]
MVWVHGYCLCWYHSNKDAGLYFLSQQVSVGLIVDLDSIEELFTSISFP